MSVNIYNKKSKLSHSYYYKIGSIDVIRMKQIGQVC